MRSVSGSDPETTPQESLMFFPAVRPIAGPDSRRTRTALVGRARILVDLAGSEPHLRARLESATRVVTPRD